MGHIERYRGVLLTNQTSILFSSEPDISLLSKQGTTLGVIEVKGGADPAGSISSTTTPNQPGQAHYLAAEGKRSYSCSGSKGWEAAKMGEEGQAQELEWGSGFHLVA